MKYLLIVALAVLASAANAQEPGDAFCYFETDGTIVIQGRCQFAAQGGGSFKIFDRLPDFGHFANLLVSSDGQGAGYWNGAPGNTHAHEPLGRMIRVGGCWVNAQSRICAWK
ncbi:hypothetical protein DC366_14015 [Pelagivirga sediminicola]|uniref:Uncharacterized protein n=1 Tax=Pelagivirga sediminicola TaxID=2170575 RepID=A0A2T7G531_9RHOB|nr:hypothetical protein [Pelagivirga sediminicola]PVA09496.1 hypothetical protein DC366_14015 [Pelagivirga sediminicola]